MMASFQVRLLNAPIAAMFLKGATTAGAALGYCGGSGGHEHITPENHARRAEG
jgi:hypothetical protein